MIYKTPSEPIISMQKIAPVKKLYEFAGYLFVASVFLAAIMHVNIF